ncbi:glycosyltransferase family 90 protein [Trichoderma austrokoningii]
MRGISHPVALICLSLSAYFLSARYYTSASFERPVHFSVITLLLTGLSLLASAYHRSRQGDYQSLTVIANHKSSIDLVQPTSPVIKYTRIGLENLRHLHPSFPFLLLCIGLRTWLYWAVIRTTQCSRAGIEAFLPFFTVVAEAIGPFFALPASQYRSLNKRPTQSMPSKSQIIFAFLALVWPLFVISSNESSIIATGTICPIGWRWERFIPLIQLFNSVLDAAIISHTSLLARTAKDDEIDIAAFMSKISFAAAGNILLLSFPSWLSDSEFIMAFWFRALENRDFAIDGLLATISILCSISLLPSLHPACLALLVTTAIFMGSQIPARSVMSVLPSSSYDGLTKHTILAILVAVPLWYLAISVHHADDSATSRELFKWHILCSSGFALLALETIARLLFFKHSSMVTVDVAIKSLVSEASAHAFSWELQAAVSVSLADAASEYTKRYGIPPPPNFDKWHEFAKRHDSAVIDHFDQIYNDLLPFWGLDAGHIRDQTTRVFEYGSSEMGGMRIRNGSVEQSPYIPASHRWMTDSLQKMIEPFSQWLPDMDMAINLADECRMAVPFEQMEQLKASARKNRDKVKGRKEEEGWPSGQFTWPKDFPEPKPRAENGRKDAIDPQFTNNIRRPIFYDFVAPTCPPDSVVNSKRWWDWSKICVNCISPYSVLTSSGALLANISLAHDLCHQPDAAYLSGFLNSPSAMVGTTEVFPIFSQARVGGFSDILIPSPWNFDEKSVFKEDSGMAWEEKANGLFWRGSRSDGFSAHGRWPGFLRPRFVHEAYEKTVSINSPVSVNVSFIGEISKCDGRECAVESETYAKWGLATMDKNSSNTDTDRLPPSVPFEEHWRYRHLMDMDGAGFSGRFLPFLASRSLPYRAAVFRTWYDERLQAWHHYVPADLRLGSGFWSAFEFFSGGSNDRKGQGLDMAKKIAEQGRDWTRKALRKEDMQIYMFRLLLEWGRITHDEREHLGFTV